MQQGDGAWIYDGEHREHNEDLLSQNEICIDTTNLPGNLTTCGLSPDNAPAEHRTV
jgi:hypothetical protein